MKHLKKFNEEFDPMGSWNPNHPSNKTKKEDICDECDGAGMTMCYSCNGQGSRIMGGYNKREVTCISCNGKGKVTCAECDGKGHNL